MGESENAVRRPTANQLPKLQQSLPFSSNNQEIWCELLSTYKWPPRTLRVVQLIVKQSPWRREVWSLLNPYPIVLNLSNESRSYVNDSPSRESSSPNTTERLHQSCLLLAIGCPQVLNALF